MNSPQSKELAKYCYDRSKRILIVSLVLTDVFLFALVVGSYVFQEYHTMGA